MPSRLALVVVALASGCGSRLGLVGVDGGVLVMGDLAGAPETGADLGPPLPAGSVGPHGGRVDRLYFAFHGDTRPPNCDQTSLYPRTIIEGIFTQEAKLGVQFAVDLGDHMFVCNSSLMEAETQMGYYTSAAQLLGKTVFMTMGNHECTNGHYCSPASTDANYLAYTQALKPVSALPYYRFDVKTSSGLAAFVVVADNAWDSAQQQWLESTLTTTDTAARYTIVTRHHPYNNSQLQNSSIWQIIQAHRYSLFLTGHTHEYRHDTAADASGRTLRMGCGGAPLANSNFYGFGTVRQGADDKLTVTIYDQASLAIQDAFSVDPQ